MKSFSYLEIGKIFNIRRGDVLFVSSDIRRLFIFEMLKNHIAPDANMLIDSFIDIVGSEGTLIFPVYNWGFCKGEPFNYNLTPGMTGALGNVALKRSDFKRTQHPIYSFAVWGRDQSYLCGLTNKSSFGEDSPFGYLDNHYAKNLIIDLDLIRCYTFIHYVEQMSKSVSYRYEKPFTSLYIDVNGKQEERTYSMFVRHLEYTVTSNFEPIQQYFIKEGIAECKTHNGVSYMMVDMHNSVSPVLEDIYNNKSRKICIYDGQNE